MKITVLCLLSTILIINCSLLYPRFIFQQAMTQQAVNNLTQAAALFKKAETAMPDIISTWFAPADLFRLYTNYGQTLYRLATADWQQKGLDMTILDNLTRSKSYLAMAAEIEPDNYINTYWLAQAEQGLETAYPWLNPRSPENPYNADPVYHKAMSLRPSGITVRYAYVKYLASRGLTALIPARVEAITQLHPPSYWHLKNEPFFNDTLVPYLEQGLKTALEKNTLAQDALKALSDISLVRNDLENAISYYIQSIDLEPSEPPSHSYLHLGSLYLKQEQYEKSFDSFNKSLQISGNTSMNQIYARFKQEKKLPEFLKFSRFLQENARPPSKTDVSLDMSVAACWMDMGFPELSKARLIKINAVKPHAPALFQLANLAAREKNWDQMEICAQKAALLDPGNLGYYNLFVQSLVIQNKYTHAEEAATQAIRLAPDNNPWVFHTRAGIRWQLKQYTPAASDWQKAFAIKPDHSDFAYRIALALEQEGRFDKALTFAQKALALDPDKKSYKTLKNRLKPHNLRPSE